MAKSNQNITEIAGNFTTTTSGNPFAVLDQRNPAMFQQELRPGAAASPINPIYCPPHIQIAWAVEQGNGSISELRYEKGYEQATLEMVTSDPKEALEKGLICLRNYTPDTTGKYVKYRELYLMVTKREWWENRQRLAAQQAKADIEGLPNRVPGATVEHKSTQGAMDEMERFFADTDKE